MLLCERIEQRVTVASRRADRLTQAILTKAFRGELVPTEVELARREGRGYEPASVPLARIRAKHATRDAACLGRAALGAPKSRGQGVTTGGGRGGAGRDPAKAPAHKAV